MHGSDQSRLENQLHGARSDRKLKRCDVRDLKLIFQSIRQAMNRLLFPTARARENQVPMLFHVYNSKLNMFIPVSICLYQSIEML